MKDNQHATSASGARNNGGLEEKKDQEINKEQKHGEHYTAGNETQEIATNDGSVIETLDTAFHGTPGWSEGENLSGSNRADYYEARSNGKSDSEEELDEMRERNKPPSP